MEQPIIIEPMPPRKRKTLFLGQVIGLVGAGAMIGGIFAPAAIAFPLKHVTWAEGYNGPGRFMAIIAIGLAVGCILGSRILVNIAALLATLLFATVVYMTHSPYSELQRFLWGHGLMVTNLIGAVSFEWGTWIIALGVLLSLVASTCKLR
jgi:hypothetical protein